MFKDNLIQLRKMKGLTQEDLAEKVGVTRQA
ncbi:MAG: helix-turn-helix domain-containing protein, partial [Lachnospiraceae bacterium]|nr:helix-turn-helix domain-containing protein [Lachnospiraceae bacterium]